MTFQTWKFIQVYHFFKLNIEVSIPGPFLSPPNTYYFVIVANTHSCIYTLHDQPVVGVVYNFALNQLFAAKKGAGATMNGDPIHVSQCTGMVLALRPWPSFWVQVTKAVRVPKNEAINRNGFLKQRSIRQERMYSPWPPFRAEPGNDTDRSGL